MITGKVTNREALVELDVLGPGQSPRRIEAAIDTGYNGYVALPSDMISSMQLPFAGHRWGRLADGGLMVLDIYLVTVSWHGRRQDVLVSQVPGTPLIGMSMLHRSRITMDVIENGNVTIDQLP